MIYRYILFFFTFCMYSHSQAQWEKTLIPGQPYNSYQYKNVFFLDEKEGWVWNENQIYHTNDGYKWDLVYQNINTLIYSIVFINSYEGLMSLDSNKILKTYDGGWTWDSVVLEAYPYKDIRVEKFAKLDSVIVGSTRNSYLDYEFIYSKDKGYTWEKVKIYESWISIKDMLFYSSTNGIVTGRRVGKNNVFLHTKDKGKSWETINEYVDDDQIKSLQFYNETFYAIPDKQNPATYKPNYYLQSNDFGLTWDKVFFDTIGIEDTSIVVTHTDSLILYDTIIKTRFPICHSLIFIDENVGYISTIQYKTGFYKTIDGGETWNFKEFPIIINGFYSLDNNQFYGLGDRVYKYYNLSLNTNTFNENPFNKAFSFVYPNPVYHHINVSFFEIQYDVSISVFDLSGKEVLRKPDLMGTEAVKVTLKNRLIPGIYFLKVTTVDNIDVHKFIKL